MPMVQPCIQPGCSTLTMGELCLEHERQAGMAPHAAARPLLHRLATAGALVAIATAGALIHTRLPR